MRLVNPLAFALGVRRRLAVWARLDGKRGALREGLQDERDYPKRLLEAERIVGVQSVDRQLGFLNIGAGFGFPCPQRGGSILQPSNRRCRAGVFKHMNGFGPCRHAHERGSCGPIPPRLTSC